MPQAMETSNRKTMPTFAVVSQRLMVRLGENRAPACAYQVVIPLLGYSFGKETCFPSHATIQTWCGGKKSIALSTIRKALKWLEDHGFIKRNHHRSKERYILFIDPPENFTGDREKRSTAKKIAEEIKSDQPVRSEKAQRTAITGQGNEQDTRNQLSGAEKAITSKPINLPKATEYRGQNKSPERETNDTATNVAHKNRRQEMTPEASTQSKRRVRKPFQQRRRSKQERAFVKAQKLNEEQRIREEHSDWHRKQRLERLILGIAITKHLPPLDYRSDIEHVEGYVQDYLDSASPLAYQLLKINDKRAFLRLTKHLVWERRQEFICS